MKRARHNRLQQRLITAAVAACFAAEVAYANPVGPVVVNGQVTFAQAGSALSVTNSPGSIINWQQFSIGAGEATRFIQPSPASAVLNRVVGVDPSSILGALQSNGRVFLINPNGILFGAGARIDVAGLVASTLKLSNEDFIAGRLNFVGDPAKAAAVVNQGRITAGEGGRVYLVGSAVDNQGVITAPTGDVVLAAGSSVRVTESAGGRLQVEISAPADSPIRLSDTVYGLRGIYGGLVRNSGVISADAAVRTTDGRIILKASKDVTLEGTSRVAANGAQGGSITAQAESGTLLVDGTIKATGSEAKGGTVALLGVRVGLINAAQVDVSGKAGGGTVLVGGDYQGGNPEVKNSILTFVGSDVTMNADALADGNGGKVIVWADDTTRFGGTISARGGAQGGDGGFVEVSGKNTLVFKGAVDTRAPRGRTGMLLLDPANITISNGTGDSTDDGDALNNSFSGVPSGVTGTVIGTDNPAAGTLTLFESELEGIAATTSISLAATSNITINNLTDNLLNLAQTAGNSVTFNAGGTFSMTAGDTIQTAGGALNVIAPGGATLGALATAGGAITIDVGAASTASGVISGAGTSLTKQGAGTLTITAANTYTGDTVINAGTLALGNNNRIEDASAVTVAAGATFELATFTETIGSLAGAGTVNKAGAGTDTLTAGGDNTSTTFSGVIQNAAGALNLTKSGTGTFTLSGANTYNGVTRINAGVLSTSLLADGGVASSIGASTNAAANLALAGGTLQYTGATVSTDRNFTLIGGTTSTVDVTSAGTTLTISGASTATTGALTKAGPGTLNLSGANLYTGLTTINAGTLSYGVNNALATGAVTVNDGGTYDLAGFSDSIGALTANSGSTGATVTTGAGTLTLTGNITSTGGAANASISGNLAFGATRTVTTTNAADGLDISAAISGAGGLTKAGAGTVTLSGANTYTGTTAVNAGTLRLAGGDAIADTGVVTLANTADVTLDLNGTSETIGSLAGGGANGGNVTLGAGTLTTGGNNATTTYSGAIGGTGGIVKEGTGNFTLAGTSNYDGVTTISVGTLTATSADALGGAAGGTTVNPGTTLALNGTLTWAEPVTLAGGTLSRAGGNPTLTGAVDLAADSIVTAAAGTLTLSGDVSGAGALSKTGAGIVVLSGSNTYTGPTNVNVGTLRVAGGNGIGDASAVNMGGGTLDLNGTTETIGSLAGTTNVTLGTGTLITGGNDASTSYSGVISGAGGSLTKDGAGTLTLAGSNTYTGATTINTGTLALGNNNRIADASAVVVVAGASFDLSGFSDTVGSIAGAGLITTTVGAGTVTLNVGGDSTSTTFSGVIENQSGTLALTKSGAGTLTLSGVNTYAGTTSINAGTLQFAGAGALDAANAVTLANTAGVTLDLNGTDQTIGSLAGGGGTGGVVTNSAAGAVTLTTGGNDAST
ncbi:MAG TPA: autotransporter-associated beta strand repeat-containing protein, partial [Burkholderiales bacterium]|nr:autotransporter-associated beta strand repeat-containing protein [Burkholderiales bacterium]